MSEFKYLAGHEKDVDDDKTDYAMAKNKIQLEIAYQEDLQKSG